MSDSIKTGHLAYRTVTVGDPISDGRELHPNFWCWGDDGELYVVDARMTAGEFRAAIACGVLYEMTYDGATREDS